MSQRPFTTGKIVLIAVLGAFILLALWVMSSYNSLVTLDENAKTAQADVEVQYQRRFDLIPDLVKGVEASLKQEQDVFGALAEARTRYAGAPSGSPEKIAALNQVESSLSRLLVIVENYPNLRSMEVVLSFQDQLEGTENRISVSRSTYNTYVNEFNKKVNRFPSNVVAGLFNFDERARFEAVEQAATAPVVDFNVQ